MTKQDWHKKHRQKRKDKKTETKTRREQIEHASLKPSYNSRIRQEYIDQDYTDKLDDTVKNCKLPNGEMVTELEYLSLFMEEWNNGSVGAQADAEQNNFHRTAEEVKECTDRNNHRNADLYGILRNKADRKNNKKLLSYEALTSTTMDSSNHNSRMEDELSKDINPASMEEAYVNFLESKEIEAMIQEYDLAMEKFTEI